MAHNHNTLDDALGCGTCQAEARRGLVREAVMCAKPGAVSSSGQYYIYTKDRDERAGFMDHCIVWWRPNAAGYTNDLNEAGIYGDGPDRASRERSGVVYVPWEAARAVAKTSTHVWIQDVRQ